MTLMLFLLLLWNMFSSCVPQCLVPFFTNSACRGDAPISAPKKMSFYQCAERCLLGDTIVCMAFMWKQSENECIISARTCQTSFTSNPGSTIMSRLICNVRDSLTLDTVRKEKYRQTRPLLNLKSEIECKSFCSALEDCLGIIWSSDKFICTVYESYNLHDKYRMELDGKTSGRCATLRVGANSYGGIRTTMQLWSCLAKLDQDDIRAVEWSTADRLCYLHYKNHRFSSGYRPEMGPVIQLEKKPNCEMNRSAVCFSRSVGHKMEGGLLVNHTPMALSRCRELCEYSTNCLAFSFKESRSQCLVFTLLMPLIPHQEFVTYLTSPCTAEHNEPSKNTSRSAHRLTSVCFSRLAGCTFQGGVLYRTLLTLSKCKQFCEYSTTCMAFSFTEGRKQCYVFTSFNQLIPNRHFDTYSKRSCAPRHGERPPDASTPAEIITLKLTSSYYKRISPYHRTVRSTAQHSLIKCAWMCEMTTRCVGFSRESQPRRQKSDCHLKTNSADAEFRKLSK